MDKDLARHVIATSFHGLSLLQGILPMLKQHCSADEYDAYVKAIASITGHVTMELLNLVFSQFPDLEKEVEAKVKKYGKFI